MFKRRLLPPVAVDVVALGTSGAGTRFVIVERAPGSA